jgi:hypothetical protein
MGHLESRTVAMMSIQNCGGHRDSTRAVGGGKNSRSEPDSSSAGDPPRLIAGPRDGKRDPVNRDGPGTRPCPMARSRKWYKWRAARSNAPPEMRGKQVRVQAHRGVTNVHSRTRADADLGTRSC